MEFQAELASELLYNANQQYSCKDCPAKCCRLPWQISLTSAEVERYQQTPWIVERLEEAETQLVSKSGQAALPRIKHNNGDSACVFLDDDNLCSMQKNEGHAFIPLTCQEYPFGAIRDTQTDASGCETVHQMQLNTSFACRSILYNYGEPLNNIAESKYQSLLQHNRIGKFPEELYIGKIRLPKEQYLSLLKACESLFHRSDLSAIQGLLLVRNILWEITEQHTGNQDQLSDEVLQAAIEAVSQISPSDLIPEGIETNTLAANTLITFNLFRFLEEEGDTKQNQLSKIKTFISLLQQNGVYRFWDFPKPVHLKDATKISIPEGLLDIQYQLKRYYASLFFNKTTFFKNTDLLQSMLLIAASYPTILKIARLHALAHDRQTVILEDILESIGYTDVCISSIGPKPKTLLGKSFQLILSLLANLPDTYIRILYSECHEPTNTHA